MTIERPSKRSVAMRAGNDRNQSPQIPWRAVIAVIAVINHRTRSCCAQKWKSLTCNYRNERNHWSPHARGARTHACVVSTFVPTGGGRILTNDKITHFRGAVLENGLWLTRPACTGRRFTPPAPPDDPRYSNQPTCRLCAKYGVRTGSPTWLRREAYDGSGAQS